MSLSAKYQAFLANPTPQSGALAENASLHYITTLTSINDAAAIFKHFAVQERLLKKKGQKVLSAIESAHGGLCLDIETTLEFVAGGGAYLPGLDDNFVSDRTVTFPMVHIVHFDQQQKIVQIRQYWDQGSLLKQIDVIGARARNWPIRDGKDQTRLIATNAAAVVQPEPAASSRTSAASRGADEVSVSDFSRPRRSTNNNAMNDPHSTLALFEPRDVNQESSHSSKPAAARAQSAKPKPRDLNELFVDENGAPGYSDATASPHKSGKAGGGKNYKPNRLFGNTEEEGPVPTPSTIKTNPKKYNHFEFGDGHDEDDATPKGHEASRPTSKAKGQPQWGFDDFNTPAKQKVKILGQNVRHFGWSDDEEDASPVRREVVHKARPDADPHFEFKDDGTSEGQRREPAAKGRLHNKGLGLYEDHVLGNEGDAEEGAHQGDSKHSLEDVSTISQNENRKKDFGSKWDMEDESPANPNRGISISGDGMGGRKGADPGAANANRGIAISGNGMGGRKGTEAGWSMYEQSPEQAKNRGVKSVGNGMGGRKGTGRSWEIGDEDDATAQPKRKNNAPSAESKGFWDF